MFCDICDRPAVVKHDNGSGVVNLCSSCGANVPEARPLAGILSDMGSDASAFFGSFDRVLGR